MCVGATIAKARSPLVFNLVLGTLSRPLVEDVSDYICGTEVQPNNPGPGHGELYT